MSHIEALADRNSNYPYPIAFPDDASRYEDLASLAQLRIFNDQQGNAITVAILDLISRCCCDGLAELKSQHNVEVWYQWGHSTWSPGILKHIEIGQIIVGQQRRKRISKANCPHRGYSRDDESDVICQWFELLPKTKLKPKPIRDRSWYSDIVNQLMSLDAELDIDSIQLYYHHLGQLLSRC